jgi:hypothetical protein
MRRFYCRHGTLEEKPILPAANESFSTDDWEVVDAAFAQNNDPLLGGGYGREYEKLFSLITTITPAPIGVGPALQ